MAHSFVMEAAECDGLMSALGPFSGVLRRNCRVRSPPKPEVWVALTPIATGLQRRLHHGISLLHVEERAPYRNRGRKLQGDQNSFAPWPPEQICGLIGAPHFKELPAGSRRHALLRRVQIALKPASKTLGPHRVFIRRKGLMHAIADGAFKRVQVDAGACQLDTDEHHRGLALRTSGALNCNEWNDGRQALRLCHDASLE